MRAAAGQHGSAIAGPGDEAANAITDHTRRTLTKAPSIYLT